MTRLSIDRLEGESLRDHIQRLSVDPLVQGSTDVEIARIARCSPERARELRLETTLLSFADDLRAHLVRPLDETSIEFIRRALVAFAWKHCEHGRCTHDVCERARMATRRAA